MHFFLFYSNVFTFTVFIYKYLVKNTGGTRKGCHTKRNFVIVNHRLKYKKNHALLLFFTKWKIHFLFYFICIAVSAKPKLNEKWFLVTERKPNSKLKLRF
jgi:hypothetical protein